MIPLSYMLQKACDTFLQSVRGDSNKDSKEKESLNPFTERVILNLSDPEQAFGRKTDQSRPFS